MNKPTLLCTLSTTLFLNAFAQEPAMSESKVSPPKDHPVGLAIEAGTTGLGGTLAWRFHRNLGLRGGMHYFDYSRQDTIEDVTYDAKLRLQSEPFTLDIYPWSKKSFRISAGILVNQNELTGDSDGAFSINGTAYANERLSFKATQNDICPYLGIGGNFFYFDQARRWSLGGDLGIAYTGSPEIILSNPTGGVPAADLDRARQDIDDEVRDFKFWPVIKLGVTFRF